MLALSIVECFWSPPLDRPLVGHTVLLCSHSFFFFFCDLMLRIKALEEEGLTFSSLTWLTASPQAPGRGIRASAGSASRNLNP